MGAHLDRLFASPRYGEHQARFWLDAARYADTHGYHLDNERTMWKYRDHVVDAFNANQPFDEFTIEALAGDPGGAHIGAACGLGLQPMPFDDQ